MRAGAERAEVTVEQVLRELAKIGFSDIRKAVAWRNEMVAREGEEEEEGKGEDGVVRVTRVLLPRVSIVPSEEMDPDIAAAIAQISQGPNGEVRVRLHDKHGPLVSIGKHLGMFVGRLQIQERKRSALSRCLLRSGGGSMSGKANELGMAAASGPTEGALRMPAEGKPVRPQPAC